MSSVSCSCAKHAGVCNWECKVTGDRCMFILPDSVKCATLYGEGPASKGLENFNFRFFTFDGKSHEASVYAVDEHDARLRLRRYYEQKICQIELIKEPQNTNLSSYSC